MSTRSTIIHKNTEGKYEGIYCHSDGYPSHHVPILLENYSTPEKVAELIALGGLSRLAPRLVPEGPHSFDNPEKGTVVAYVRDRGEPMENNSPLVGNSIKEVADQFENGMDYVFEDGAWTFNGNPLAEAVAAEDE